MLFSDDFQPVLAMMKFLVESEFQGQGPPRTQETTKTTGTIRIPRVGFGTDRPYIALFWTDLPRPGHHPGISESTAAGACPAGPPMAGRQLGRSMSWCLAPEGGWRAGPEGRSQKRAI